MLASDFQRRLQKLNKRLRVYAGNDSSKPAGVTYLDPYEGYVEICGVDKNYVHEFPTYNRYGKMIKGGWRRVIQTLVQKKLIDRRQSYKLFGYWDEHREKPQTFDKPDVDRAIEDLESRCRDGSPRKDDLMDVGRMLRKKNNR